MVNSAYVIREARVDDVRGISELLVRLKKLNGEFDPMYKVVSNVIEKAESYTKEALGSNKDVVLVAQLSNSGDEVYICVDDNRRIVELGKHIEDAEKSNALGELVGISRFSKVFLEELFEQARKDYQNSKLDYHYEECMFAVSKLKSPVYAMLCKDLAWIEIDNRADLERAKDQVYSQIRRKLE